MLTLVGRPEANFSAAELAVHSIPLGDISTEQRVLTSRFAPRQNLFPVLNVSYIGLQLKR
jgi:hypothetical protein